MATEPTSGLRALCALAAAVVFTAAAAGCGGAEDSSEAAGERSDTGESAEVDTYSGYVVDPPVVVGDVVLPLADGSGEWQMTADPGGLELVYFGYTFCPDVCPTTMSDVRRTLEALPEDEADRVGVAMVTIDPARDTTDVITGYVENFVPDGAALRTDDEVLLRSAADAIGADYEVTTASDGEVEVKHTGELYAVDDTGTVVMQWPFGTSQEALERDLRSLLAERSAD